MGAVSAVDLNGFLGSTLPGTMAAGREIVEEPMARAIEEKIYVALGKEVAKNMSVLVWALHNSGGKRICIVHVHQPPRMIPLLGGKFPVSSLKKEQVQAYREVEKQDMHKILDQYLSICVRTGVHAEKLFIEMDSIERGILELISQHGVKKLVMGGTADKRYSRYKHHKKMVDLKSKKANYVREQAPTSCHIWFICKGYLIHTSREGTLVGSDAMASSSCMSPSQSPQSKGLDYSRSRSAAHPLSDPVTPAHLIHDSLRTVRSADYEGVEGTASAPFSLDGTEGSSTPGSRPDTEVSADEWVGSRRSPSHGSNVFSLSPSRMADLASVSLMQREGARNALDSCSVSHLMEHIQQPSPPNVLEGSMDGTVYEQLEQAMEDSANSRREAFEEALRRAKAEKDAIEAIRRFRAAELLHSEEQNKRKEIEETLKKEKEELVKVKNQHDLIMEELRNASHEQLLSKNHVAEAEEVVKELEDKIISAVQLLQTYKKERDELEIEREKALKEAEELRSKAEASSSIHVRKFFTEFSFSEIKEATQNFDPTLKIGEGGYGSIYKALLHHTQVAIKMLHSNSMQGPSEFQQEVDVLSKMRHPNLVTLVGACPEAWALVYDYLPNGSLEDRLTCRDNSPPLSWQSRIRIAAELCSVLIFLHSSRPHSIVHGDLKPSNILLDQNFVSKLSDFGICRLLARDGSLIGNKTVCCRTDPKGTFVYMDPEFLSTGELSLKSDVYSFGIILLRLLTGGPALGITKEVQYALDSDTLKNLLDPLAGDWPFVQAEQLARLALRCCEMNRRSRPDLETEVWRIVEPMRASCGGCLSFRLISEERHQPPSYFICPIFQEIMQDPHIAADGFTYEGEALRGWLDSGHDTSPMTNLKLAHRNLVPNHALRSAIQEWLQRH